jgi:hypothetical protein
MLLIIGITQVFKFCSLLQCCRRISGKDVARKSFEKALERIPYAWSIWNDFVSFEEQQQHQQGEAIDTSQNKASLISKLRLRQNYECSLRQQLQQQ